jgi:hypothetical protein
VNAVHSERSDRGPVMRHSAPGVKYAGHPSSEGRCHRGEGRLLVVQHEGDEHVHAVLGDLAAVDGDLLLLNPRAFTFRSVWCARSMPEFIASSKLTSDVADISVTRAIDISVGPALSVRMTAVWQCSAVRHGPKGPLFGAGGLFPAPP